MGTLIRKMFHHKFGGMTLYIDYTIYSLEKEIILSNPRVDIPSLQIVQADARQHPMWRVTISDPAFKDEVKADLMKQETYAMFCTINYKELMN